MRFPTYPAKRRDDGAVEIAAIESAAQLKQVNSETSDLREGAMIGKWRKDFNCFSSSTR